MKRCPQCNSLFNDAEHFCELDGTPLVEENAPVVNNAAPPERDSLDTKGVLLIGGLAGVIIGMLLFLVYFALTKEKPQDETSPPSSNVSVAQPQLPARPVEALPESSPSPSVEPSPSPTVEPSPTVQPTPAQLQLSGNPISTAGAKSGPVLIKLQTGTSIEAEEAWQTGEGIWYRKSGVVSLLDPKDVKAIEKAPSPSPQPSPASTKP
jgi:cytoskeletal protein RodZ